MSAPQYVQFPNHRPQVYNPALMLTTLHTEEQSGATTDTETGCTLYRVQPAKDNIALRLVAHKDNPARPKPRALQASLHKLSARVGLERIVLGLSMLNYFWI